MQKTLFYMITLIITCTPVLTPSVALAKDDNTSPEATREIACGEYKKQSQYILNCYQDEKLVCENNSDECWCQLDSQCQKQCMSDQSCGQKANNNS